MKEIKMPFEEYEKMQKEIASLKEEVNLHRGNIPSIFFHTHGYSFRDPGLVELTEAQKEIKVIIDENTELRKQYQYISRQVRSLERKLKYFNTLTLWERISYKPQSYTDENFL